MSIRSHTNRINSFAASAAPSHPIDFRDDFVNSAAVYAANTDETVSQIMQRLDQLQSKIASGEPQAAAPVPAARAARPPSSGDLTARVATLESIHEDTLARLGAKLDVVERKLNEQREVESLMGQISAKFSRIESQLNAAKESEGLMNKVATKFSAVESRLQSATQLSDRVARLESRLGSHADLHARVTKLESGLAPDPEQERLIARIGAKLDKLERSNAAPQDDHLGAAASVDDREDRIQYLQNRIEKLKELRSRYEAEGATN
jgi:uncharacterized phage infection (PIP) family protein YhgE